MRRDSIEIEQILENGLRILSERPELADMSISDVIDELDGSDQMISDRWGVTAHIVCQKIQKWDKKSLVHYLTNIDALELTCEYVGYLLQSKYNVALEEVIIEADQQGAFGEIVRYISPNLRFLPGVSGSNISRVLSMLAKYTDHNMYSSFLYNYAIGIASCDGYQIVMDEFGDLSSIVQYHLLGNLRRHWFENNAKEASDMIDRLLKYKSVWGKKIAIDYWEMSIQYDVSLFQAYYSRMDSLRMESEELWQQMIPTFVYFTNLADQTVELLPEYCKAVECLRKLPTDTIDSKICFLRSIEFCKELAEDLRRIYREILAVSFNQNRQALDCLDYFWYTHINSGYLQDVIQDMALCFSANKFRTSYSRFFEQINSTRSAMAEHVSLVTEIALGYMLKDDPDEIFFGLGLLINNGSVRKLFDEKMESSPDFTGLLREDQMVRIMKLMLYFSVDDSQICHFAFQLLSLSMGEHDAYTEFCLNEVYGDYPATMYEVAANYKESNVLGQGELAKKVNEAYETAADEYRKASEIMDLQSSWEHQRIYRKAQNEHSKQIRKMANEKSFVSRFFRTQALKYGVRSGHIVRGTKKEKFYQATPFQRFEKKMEIAASYVNDPVDYEMRRRSYLSEVIPDETDN